MVASCCGGSPSRNTRHAREDVFVGHLTTPKEWAQFDRRYTFVNSPEWSRWREEQRAGRITNFFLIIEDNPSHIVVSIERFDVNYDGEKYNAWYEWRDNRWVLVEELDKGSPNPMVGCEDCIGIHTHKPIDVQAIASAIRGSSENPRRYMKRLRYHGAELVVIPWGDGAKVEIYVVDGRGRRRLDQTTVDDTNEKRAVTQAKRAVDAMSASSSRAENPRPYYRRRHYFDDIKQALVDHFNFTTRQAGRAIDMYRRDIQDYYNFGRPAGFTAGVIARYFPG